APIKWKPTTHRTSGPNEGGGSVLNRGPEAERRDNIRGQIIDSSEPNVRKERTNFRGAHVVECFVLKEGVVVARDRIDVPISNTSGSHMT
ncbi:hypothetical protein M3C89_011325, partial [Micrococcus luteus]|nr:hypothetical protein [Micrococcus luteus]MCV7722052.1 hypothetical protein [Micrococcus luteus]